MAFARKIFLRAASPDGFIHNRSESCGGFTIEMCDHLSFLSILMGVYKTWPTPLAYLLAHSWLTFGLPVAYLLAYLWPTLGLPLAHLFVDSLCSNVKTRLSSNSNLPPRSVARPMPHHADPALRVAVCSVSKVCINFSFYSLITITR